MKEKVSAKIRGEGCGILHVMEKRVEIRVQYPSSL